MSQHTRCRVPRGALLIPSLSILLCLGGGARAHEGHGGHDDSHAILSVDHYVTHRSTVPAIAGQTVELFVRERVQAGMLSRRRAFTNRVVLFVHGAGTPAEVAFDLPYRDYSWMAFLAQAGFDTFAVDLTGYGRSHRPTAMNDACNLADEQQALLVPAVLEQPCTPRYPGQLTTLGSDWDDIDAVVDHIRALRGVDRISLIGWSLGGPRAGGYAARHPDKVDKLVLLAPAHWRDGPTQAPDTLPAPGAPMNVQSRAEFDANWDRQLACEGQREERIAELVWTHVLDSDPVGRSWGAGVRRAPNTTTWGWNRAVVGRMRTPALLIAPVHDAAIAPARVRELYEDLGSERKVLVDLGCASHSAQWERNRLLLFRASLEWLLRGTVEGMATGEVRLGYP